MEVFTIEFVCLTIGLGAGFWTSFTAGGGGGAIGICLLFKGVVLTRPDWVNLTTPYTKYQLGLGRRISFETYLSFIFSPPIAWQLHFEGHRLDWIVKNTTNF